MESEFYTPSQETIDRVTFLKKKKASQNVRSILLEKFRDVEKLVNSENFDIDLRYYFNMRRLPKEYASQVTAFFNKLGLSWTRKAHPEGGTMGYYYGLWN